MSAPPRTELPLEPKYDHYDFPVVPPVAQKGHPGYTTETENAQVFQLRSMLEAEGYIQRLDTLTLLRFLRARKFNVELTKKMFVDCEKWRKEFGGGVDNLVKNFDYVERPKVFEYYPQYYHKTDKDGRPVYIEKLGKVDITAINKITTQDRMLQNMVCEYEKIADPRLPACSRQAGHLLETCCTIVDLKGVGISQASSVYGYVQAASAILQNYYPERLGKLYVINAPFGFSAVFSFVKRWLDPVTVDKIHVLGWSYQKELLAQVPAENLAVEFGGTCACEGGCHMSDEGPWQDPTWYKPAQWELEMKADGKIDTTTTGGSAGVPDAAAPEAGAKTDGKADAAAPAPAPA